MVYFREHVFKRMRDRFTEFENCTDLELKEFIVVAVYDSHDIRRLKRKKIELSQLFLRIKYLYVCKKVKT